MENMYSAAVCERLEKALENEETVQKLANASSKEELGEYLHEMNIDLADDDLSAIAEQLDTYKNNDELTEEQMNSVSGGFTLVSILAGAALIGSAALVGYVTTKVGCWIVDKKYGGK